MWKNPGIETCRSYAQLVCIGNSKLLYFSATFLESFLWNDSKEHEVNDHITLNMIIDEVVCESAHSICMSSLHSTLYGAPIPHPLTYCPWCTSDVWLGIKRFSTLPIHERVSQGHKIHAAQHCCGAFECLMARKSLVLSEIVHLHCTCSDSCPSLLCRL